jgi:hypothetical protein
MLKAEGRFLPQKHEGHEELFAREGNEGREGEEW